MSGPDGRFDHGDRTRELFPPFPVPGVVRPPAEPTGLVAQMQADTETIFAEDFAVPGGDLDLMFDDDGLADTVDWFPAAGDAVEVRALAGQGEARRHEYEDSGIDRTSERIVRVRLSATGLAQVTLEDVCRIGGETWAVREIISQTRWTAHVVLVKIDEHAVHEPGRRQP